MAYAPLFSLLPQYGRSALVFFFEADCPTCRLTAPYLQKLHQAGCHIIGVSQDSPAETDAFMRHLRLGFPVYVDQGWSVSQAYDPQTVPTMVLVAPNGSIESTITGFDKADLNRLATALGYEGTLAAPYDGNPPSKPGCMSRHLEPATAIENSAALHSSPAQGASRIVIDEDEWEYCARAFGDPLPVVPPTIERVERMLRGTPLPRQETIALIPPCYGPATVEKIAANAVMAGCQPSMMRVLIPLLRAACDERFNLHGVQATTHFAAPLIIVNGPVRRELGFRCEGNVFSNVARANSTLGRAFQLILTNIGGARPGEIDMSTLGNPGKFSYCIAENEEASPWEPLHVESGSRADQSTITLFAGDGLRGIGEHTARSGNTLLKAVCATLATVWSWRVCLTPEAVVVLGPEHAETLRRDGYSKQQVRNFLFHNTGIPIRYYLEDDGGEGTQARASYDVAYIAGEPCYRKFRAPESIKIVVAGGTAGKFSAVIGSWNTGPRGSQMVTYPLE